MVAGSERASAPRARVRQFPRNHRVRLSLPVIGRCPRIGAKRNKKRLNGSLFSGEMGVKKRMEYEMSIGGCIFLNHQLYFLFMYPQD